MCSGSEPQTITAGDSLAWTRALTDFPASAGWTLHYGAACTSPVANAITFDATTATDGTSYQVTVTPDQTAAWLPGRYLWSAFVTRDTPTAERHTLFRGSFTVLPDPAATAVALGHAQRTLTLIEAALEGRIPRGLEETTIDGQQITRIAILDLHTLRQKYRTEVMDLERAAAAAAGVRGASTLYVRFRNPRGPTGNFHAR